MKNVMLIDVESVKKLGYVHQNVLPDTIAVTIRRVQQTMLKSVMGKTAYEDLINKVSASLPPTTPIVPLTPETKELIEDYIQPYLVACVDYRIIYPLTIRSRSKSVGKGVDENHTPADITELIKLKDQMRSDVDAYAEILLDKLNENSCESKNESRSTTPWNSIKFR
jgi:hypothetical protein